MASPDDTQRQRRTRFAQLVDDFGGSLDDYDRGEEEDPRRFTDDHEPISEWVCITTHHDRPFFLPTFDTPDAAQARATEYVHDDIWEEYPYAVVSLDSGATFRADYSRIPWTTDEQPHTFGEWREETLHDGTRVRSYWLPGAADPYLVEEI